MLNERFPYMAAGIVAALCAAPAALAQAESPGFYISGGYSFQSFDGEGDLDTEVNSFTARAGWLVNHWLAVEADVSFGFDDGDFTFNADEEDFDLDDNGDGDILDVISAPGEFGLNYSAGAFAKASYPMSDAFDIFARIGYSFFDVDTTIRTPGGRDISLGDSESGASFGAGAEWDFNEHHSVRGDYTYTDFDFAKVDVWGIMYQLKF